jgi:hypothetical protein
MKKRMIAIVVGVILGVPMSCVKTITEAPDASVSADADGGESECVEDAGEAK